jgi:pimeloyl-ACP methyl ester carboxylesterase
MTTVHHRYATVNEQRLFYRAAGPAGVLLHGFSASSFMFRRLISLLVELYYVIAPDHLGFSLSDAPESELCTVAGYIRGFLGMMPV